MEQINFIQEQEDQFLLSVFYNYSLYETRLMTEKFHSDIIELEYLDDVIQQGLRPNQVKKVDENLTVTTHIVEEVESQQLKVQVKLVFKKGKLKSTTENHEFVLTKKEIDTQQTFENVLRGTERSLNLPHIQPHSTNFFISINHELKQVHYTDEHQEKIVLVQTNEFDYRLLEYLERKFLKVREFYQNKQKSQDSILQFNSGFITEMFQSHQIYAVLANYFAYAYFCNFISVVMRGRLVIVNVSTNKQPKELVYHVTDSIDRFDFNPVLHYRILSQFSVGHSNQSVKGCSEVEIMNANSVFYVYENRKLAQNKWVHIKDKNFYIKTDANGRLEKFYRADRTSVYNGEGNSIMAPSKILRINTDGNGNYSSAYVAHCSGTAQCSCWSWNSHQYNSGAKLLFQEPEFEASSGVDLDNVFLIEQF